MDEKKRRFGVNGPNIFAYESELKKIAEQFLEDLEKLKAADPKVIAYVLTGEWPKDHGKDE